MATGKAQKIETASTASTALGGQGISLPWTATEDGIVNVVYWSATSSSNTFFSVQTSGGAVVFGAASMSGGVIAGAFVVKKGTRYQVRQNVNQGSVGYTFYPFRTSIQ